LGYVLIVARGSVISLLAAVAIRLTVRVRCVAFRVPGLVAGMLPPSFACGWCRRLGVLRARVHGGAAARLARVVRLRRRRVFGGRPREARRWLSSCRAFQAVMMRWLRTMSRVVVNSISGARPMRRHQPRLMSLLAGSLAVAKPRSAPVRRA